jgi:hypothetical protein
VFGTERTQSVGPMLYDVEHRGVSPFDDAPSAVAGADLRIRPYQMSRGQGRPEGAAAWSAETHDVPSPAPAGLERLCWQDDDVALAA